MINVVWVFFNVIGDRNDIFINPGETVALSSYNNSI